MSKGIPVVYYMGNIEWMIHFIFPNSGEFEKKNATKISFHNYKCFVGVFSLYQLRDLLNYIYTLVLLNHILYSWDIDDIEGSTSIRMHCNL